MEEMTLKERASLCRIHQVVRERQSPEGRQQPHRHRHRHSHIRPRGLKVVF